MLTLDYLHLYINIFHLEYILSFTHDVLNLIMQVFFKM